MSKNQTLFKTSIDWENQAVKVDFNDRSVTVQKDRNVEGSITHGIYMERPAKGIKQNDTLGHYFDNGRSVTCFGLSDEAAAGLCGALLTYIEEFTDKKRPVTTSTKD